jgi:hypothetical protein
MFKINLSYENMNLKFYSSEDDALRALREGKHKAKELVSTLNTFPQYKKLKANDFTIEVRFYEPQLEMFPEYKNRKINQPVMTKVPHGPTLRNLK